MLQGKQQLNPQRGLHFCWRSVNFLVIAWLFPRDFSASLLPVFGQCTTNLRLFRRRAAANPWVGSSATVSQWSTSRPRGVEAPPCYGRTHPSGYRRRYGFRHAQPTNCSASSRNQDGNTVSVAGRNFGCKFHLIYCTSHAFTRGRESA